MNRASKTIRGWVKSSYSDHEDCVEVASTLDRVRDSKDVDGPVLMADVAAFVAAIKSGRFDREYKLYPG